MKGHAMDERKDSTFTKWLLAKDERFYVLFLVVTLIIFTVLSLFTLLLVSGVIVVCFWLIFYYAIIRKE